MEEDTLAGTRVNYRANVNDGWSSNDVINSVLVVEEYLVPRQKRELNRLRVVNIVSAEFAP